MFTDPKTLIVVYKDEILVNQIKKMVETKDDNGDESVVGTRDGSIRIVSWSEKVWLDNKKAGNISAKVLFLGSIKGTDKLLPVIDVKFDEYGVKYGWAGNQAVIFIDPSALQKREDYDSFLEKLSALPIPESIKGKTKSSTKITNLPVKPGQSGKDAIIGALTVFGFNAVMAAKDFFRDKAMVQRQMYFYGIISMYINDLETFMQV